MKLSRIKAGEWSYLLACVLSAAGIRLQVNSGLGLSMIAAPAYILSQKLSWLSQGNAEWMLQGVVFLVLCAVLRRFPVKKIWSFVAAIPYGWIFDGVSLVLGGIRASGFVGSLLVFLLGCVLLSLGIALFFKSYLPCQVHEMFVKTLAEERGWKQGRVKSVYDACFLVISLSLSLLFFGRLDGIGLGTVLCTLVNGPLIGLWLRLMDGRINDAALLPGLKRYFAE